MYLLRQMYPEFRHEALVSLPAVAYDLLVPYKDELAQRGCVGPQGTMGVNFPTDRNKTL